MKKLLSPPAWFRVRSPVQADTIAAAMLEEERIEDLQKREFEKSRAEALPYMAELLRELDATSQAQVRGDIRVWTPEAYARVMASPWQKFLSYVRTLCISFRSTFL